MPAEPVTVTLVEPIQAHGETITSLKLRPPNAADAMACGMPFKMGIDPGAQSMSPDLNAEAIGKLIPRLASIPPSSAASLSLTDFWACAAAIMGFMRPPAASQPEHPLSSTDTSISPGGGDARPISSLRSVGTS
jgi:hypothetical protein